MDQDQAEVGRTDPEEQRAARNATGCGNVASHFFGVEIGGCPDPFTLLLLTLLGDVSSASTLAASVPTVLVQAKYSRDFEHEADDYARAWLRRQGIPVHRFGDLLRRIERSHHGQAASRDGVWSYFSSHPSTTERARD